jgi:hypothetical protein
MSFLPVNGGEGFEEVVDIQEDIVLWSVNIVKLFSPSNDTTTR